MRAESLTIEQVKALQGGTKRVGWANVHVGDRVVVRDGVRRVMSVDVRTSANVMKLDDGAEYCLFRGQVAIVLTTPVLEEPDDLVQQLMQTARDLGVE